jgi:hypothetical protein
MINNTWEAIMEELVFKQNNALTNVPDISLVPVLADEDVSLVSYTKYPLSKLNSLGVAFEPLTSAIHNVFGASGGTTQLCQVTVPAGTHLASFKSGVGNLGTVLNANNQIAGQAVINPLVCNPTMLFMAAALASIDKKLDSILETQHDMMEFLEQKEESELRGNLRFLADVFNNFRFNWNNEIFKNAGHIKVLDIRQSAEQKIDFYQKQIQSKLKKKALVQSNQDVKKRLEKISSQFKDYQLALYLFSFSSFMEVMLLENYDSEYLSGITQRIEEYSFAYRDLYTRSYDQLAGNAKSTVQSFLLRGLASASRATGEAIAKIPVINKSQIDENMIASGEKLADYQERRTVQAMNSLIDKQSSCVRPFIESINSVSKLYNKPIVMLFDNDSVYLPA